MWRSGTDYPEFGEEVIAQYYWRWGVLKHECKVCVGAVSIWSDSKGKLIWIDNGRGEDHWPVEVICWTPLPQPKFNPCCGNCRSYSGAYFRGGEEVGSCEAREQNTTATSSCRLWAGSAPCEGSEFADAMVLHPENKPSTGAI